MKEGWEIKTLEDLFDIGSSKRVYESQWRNAGVPFYRAREIVKLSRDGFVDNELFIDEELYKEYANKYGTPKCGDIMVTGVGTLGVCYIVKKNDKFYFKDGNILWFKSKEGTNPFYVNYVFKSNYLRQQIDNCNGATVGTFTIVRAKKTTIPIPPLAEQERIVAELDLLSSIIEKKKAQLKELDQLAQSIFYDMFGDPITNEKAWEVKCFGEIASFKNGLNFHPKDDGFSIKCIGVGDFQDKKVLNDFKIVKDVTIDDVVDKSYYLKDGDIIIVRSNGSKELVGRNMIVYPKKQKVTYSGFCIRCRLNTPLILPMVLNRILSHRSTMIVLRQEGRGCNISNINQKILSSLSIPLPPLALQQEFASKVEAIERQKSLIQQSIVETQTLFDSRMDYWFG